MKAKWTMLAVFAALVVGMLALGGLAWAQSSGDPNGDSTAAAEPPASAPAAPPLPVLAWQP